jgi:putative DNA primase/helicase
MKHEPVLRRLSKVRSEKVKFLWPGMIALGKLTVMIGDPGVGKSFVSVDIAARVTTGGKWPDGTRYSKKGRVILLSAEDGIADTIRPRVEAQRGDPRRIVVLEAVRGKKGHHRMFTLSKDLSVLERAIRREGASLVIIDPLSAYLGSDVDSHKDAEVRATLRPIAELAERLKVAVIGIMHLNKDASRTAMYRALGSMAFVAAPRAVFAVGKKPGDEKRRIVAPLKFNFGPLPDGLEFRIKNGGLRWSKKAADITATKLLAGEGADEESPIEEAMEFLRTLLREGSYKADEVRQKAREVGISEATLRRAKTRLNVKPRHVGGIAGSGLWVWELPQKGTKTSS